jgi:hypothetical protein
VCVCVCEDGRTETDPVSETLFSSIYKSRNPMSLNDIHNRQTPLDSTN